MVKACLFRRKRMPSSLDPQEQALLALLRGSTRLRWHHGWADACPNGVRLLKHGQSVGVWSHKAFGFVYRPAACSEAGLKIWSLHGAIGHSRALVSEVAIVRSRPTLCPRTHPPSFIAILHSVRVGLRQQLHALAGSVWFDGLRPKLRGEVTPGHGKQGGEEGPQRLTRHAGGQPGYVQVEHSDRIVRFHEALQGSRGEPSIESLAHRPISCELAKESYDGPGLMSPKGSASGSRGRSTSRRHLLKTTMRLVVPPRAKVRASGSP